MPIKETLRNSSEFSLQNGVFYQKDFKYLNAFESLYLELRQKENRNYSDELLINLPEIPGDHSRYSEWVIRKKSLRNFMHALQKKSSLRFILEVGCGNGWFSHQLAKSLPVEVCAVDINETELQQAANLFNTYQNLSFVYADILSPNFYICPFDLIVLPSSIQYFKNLRQLIGRLLDHLAPGGEIHIIDSPFYTPQAIDKAKERGRSYLQSLGCEPLSSFYFHHTIDEIKAFKYEVIFNPHSVFNRISRFLNYPTQPFYWVKISKF